MSADKIPYPETGIQRCEILLTRYELRLSIPRLIASIYACTLPDGKFSGSHLFSPIKSVPCFQLFDITGEIFTLVQAKTESVWCRFSEDSRFS
jgi:hypothetical protein